MVSNGQKRACSVALTLPRIRPIAVNAAMHGQHFSSRLFVSWLQFYALTLSCDMYSLGFIGGTEPMCWTMLHRVSLVNLSLMPMDPRRAS